MDATDNKGLITEPMGLLGRDEGVAPVEILNGPVSGPIPPLHKLFYGRSRAESAALAIAQTSEIRRMHRSGQTYGEIACHFKLPVLLVKYVVRGRDVQWWLEERTGKTARSRGCIETTLGPNKLLEGKIS